MSIDYHDEDSIESMLRSAAKSMPW